MSIKATIAASFAALAIATSPAHSDELDARIRDTVAATPRHYLNNSEARATFVSELRSVAAETGVEAAVLERLAFWESSYLPDVIGARGERGLLQVHPSTADTHGCSFSTRRSGLLCGARILAAAIDRCGSLRGGLTSHATRGKCTTKNERVTRKIEWRMSEIEGAE